MVFSFEPCCIFVLGILTGGQFVILITNKNRITVARISGKIELLSVKLKSKEDCMMPLFFSRHHF